MGDFLGRLTAQYQVDARGIVESAIEAVVTLRDETARTGKIRWRCQSTDTMLP